MLCQKHPVNAKKALFMIVNSTSTIFWRQTYTGLNQRHAGTFRGGKAAYIDKEFRLHVHGLFGQCPGRDHWTRAPCSKHVRSLPNGPCSSQNMRIPCMSCGYNSVLQVLPPSLNVVLLKAVLSKHKASIIKSDWFPLCLSVFMHTCKLTP